MIGLLRKDLFVADKSGRLLLALALIFSLIPNMSSFGNTYAMMLAMMMPLTSIAYDEKSKWDRYAAMLPYTPGQLVWSKYLLSYLYTILGGAIIVLGTFLRGMTTGSAEWQEAAETACMLAIVMMIITAVGLPMLYRFGSEKGRLGMILCMGVGIGAALGILGVFGDVPLPKLSMPVLLGIAVVLAIALTYASFRLSVRFYRNRVNGKYN